MIPTNTAYGYPRGALRRITPRRLICVHITDNPRTPPASALEEATYANRPGSNGPSAHGYINRDGTMETFVPIAYAAWSNGAIRSPKLHVPGVAEVVALVASGRNANEDYYREMECVGRSDYPITLAQRATLASIIADDAETTGLPIHRSTVHLHNDLDTIQRGNCPVPASADEEAFAGDLIARALALRLARLSLKLDAAELALSVSEAGYALAAQLRDRYLVERDTALAQRQAALDWGRRLQAFGGAILATDGPEF